MDNRKKRQTKNKKKPIINDFKQRDTKICNVFSFILKRIRNDDILNYEISMATLSFVSRCMKQKLNFNVREFIIKTRMSILFYDRDYSIPHWINFKENDTPISNLFKPCKDFLYGIFNGLLLADHWKNFKVLEGLTYEDLVDMIKIYGQQKFISMNPTICKVVNHHRVTLISHIQKDFDKTELLRYKTYIYDSLVIAKSNGYPTFQILKTTNSYYELGNVFDWLMEENLIPETYYIKPIEYYQKELLPYIREACKKIENIEYDFFKTFVYDILQAAKNDNCKLLRLIGDDNINIKTVIVKLSTKYGIALYPRFHDHWVCYVSRLKLSISKDYEIFTRRYTEIEYISWNVKCNDKIELSIHETIRIYTDSHYYHWSSVYLLLQSNLPDDVVRPIMKIFGHYMSAHFESLKWCGTPCQYDLDLDNNIKTAIYHWNKHSQSLLKNAAIDLYDLETIGIIKRYFIAPYIIVAEILIKEESHMMVIDNATSTFPHIIKENARAGHYGKGFPSLPLSLNMITNISYKCGFKPPLRP